jgi:hypothetical protein
MPSYVRVRGLGRKGIRLRSSLSGPTAVTVNNKTTVVVDLDDAATRADLAHHSSIGQLLVFGDPPRSSTVPVVDFGFTGAATQGSLSVSVTAGRLRDAANATVSGVATTVTAGAAPGTGKRVDLIQVHTTTGVVSLKAGTSATAGAVAPAADASNVGVATVIVEAGQTQVTAVNDIRPLP